MKSIDRPFGVTEMQELKNGMMVVTGKIMEMDTKLINGTVYKAKLWEKEVIPEYQIHIDNENAYGMMDHPLRDYKDIGTKLKFVYGRLTNLYISEDKTFLMGTFLIYNNEVGKNLQYFLKNGTLGVSTRGKGKTEQRGGDKIVLKYKLIGVDFVAMPSSIKALLTAKDNNSTWEDLVEDIDIGFETMSDRQDMFIEVKKNAKLDTSKYFEFKDDVNDEYICDLSGNCKLKSLFENANEEVEEIEEEINNSQEIDDTEDSQEENLTETVADMLTPHTDLDLNNFDKDIKKMSREDLERFYQKSLLEKEADKYLKLPNGQFLRKIFIAMTQSEVPTKTVTDVLTIFNTELAKGTEGEADKIKSLEAELAQKQQLLTELKSENDLKIQEVLKQNEESINLLKKEHLSKIDTLKKKASIKLNEINEQSSEQVEKVKESLAKVKEGQVEKVKEIQNGIVKTEEALNQYYSLLEDKEVIIKDYENENTDLKNRFDGLLNEVGQLTESYNEIKELSESLLAEKSQSADLYIGLSHEIKKYKENIGLLESKMEQVKQERLNVVAEKESLSKDLQTLNSNFSVTENAMKNTISRFQEEKLAMAKEMEKTVSFLEDYKALLKKAELKEQSLVEQREDFILQIDESAEILSLMENKMNMFEENVHQKDVEYKELSRKAEQLNKDLLFKTQENNAYIENNQELEDKLVDTESKLLEAEDYISQLKENANFVIEKNENLREKMALMKEKMASLKHKLNAKRYENDNFSEINKRNKELNLKINIKEKNIKDSKDGLTNLYESYEVNDDIFNEVLSPKKSKKFTKKSLLTSLKRSKLDLMDS